MPQVTCLTHTHLELNIKVYSAKEGLLFLGFLFFHIYFCFFEWQRDRDRQLERSFTCSFMSGSGLGWAKVRSSEFNQGCPCKCQPEPAAFPDSSWGSSHRSVMGTDASSSVLIIAPNTCSYNEFWHPCSSPVGSMLGSNIALLHIWLSSSSPFMSASYTWISDQ